jgi:hypothetical protein
MDDYTINKVIEEMSDGSISSENNDSSDEEYVPVRNDDDSEDEFTPSPKRRKLCKR